MPFLKFVENRVSKSNWFELKNSGCISVAIIKLVLVVFQRIKFEAINDVSGFDDQRLLAILSTTLDEFIGFFIFVLNGIIFCAGFNQSDNIFIKFLR